MRHEVHHGNCLDLLPRMNMVETADVDCIFADPPDNIDLGYGEYKDKMPDNEYIQLLHDWTYCFVDTAWTTWISFNAKWTIPMGVIAAEVMNSYPEVVIKPCVQVFTFGQHNKHDFGNNHRPLWRFQWPEGNIYPEQIKVPSWRQLNGDKRAKPGGRVPGDVIATEAETDLLQPGTVFDFPRVTGNSKQRRSWHPTQLHEDLVERCIKSSTVEGNLVIDPFAGTGTTMRVCKRLDRSCVTMDLDRSYCEKIAAENGIPQIF